MTAATQLVESIPASEQGERWLPAAGFEGRYEISDAGRVRNLHGLVLKTSRTNKGYLRVLGRFVHRLVLEAFIGPCPSGMECRHLDGNPSNNRLENLLWGTPLENANDRRRHGTVPFKLVCSNGHNRAVVGVNGSYTCRACEKARKGRIRAAALADRATEAECQARAHHAQSIVEAISRLEQLESGGIQLVQVGIDRCVNHLREMVYELLHPPGAVLSAEVEP